MGNNQSSRNVLDNKLCDATISYLWEQRGKINNYRSTPGSRVARENSRTKTVGTPAGGGGSALGFSYRDADLDNTPSYSATLLASHILFPSHGGMWWRHLRRHWNWPADASGSDVLSPVRLSSSHCEQDTFLLLAISTFRSVQGREVASGNREQNCGSRSVAHMRLMCSCHEFSHRVRKCITLWFCTLFNLIRWLLLLLCFFKANMNGSEARLSVYESSLVTS